MCSLLLCTIQVTRMIILSDMHTFQAAQPPDTTVGPGLGPHIPGYGNSLGRLLMLARGLQCGKPNTKPSDKSP